VEEDDDDEDDERAEEDDDDEDDDGDDDDDDDDEDDDDDDDEGVDGAIENADSTGKDLFSPRNCNRSMIILRSSLLLIL
jgi:hypothetical protein